MPIFWIVTLYKIGWFTGIRLYKRFTNYGQVPHTEAEIAHAMHQVTALDNCKPAHLMQKKC